MAVHFVGTRSSSFSLAIAEERGAVSRKPSETTGEMDVLTPTQDEASIGPKRKDEL
jgi:hypothetical protein